MQTEQTKNVREHINNSELVEAFRAEGGQIFHLRPSPRNRGVTFAFVQKRNRAEIATAVQHRDDDFTKKVGTKLAIEHFREGKKIVIPLRKEQSVVETLKYLKYLYW